MTEKQILKALKALAAQEKPLRSALEETRRGKRVRCEACNRGTRVRDLIYIQTHFYIAPYSRTGGDYWKQGEGQYDCPKCGRRNRLYKRPDVVALKRYFKSVVPVHER